MLGDDPEVSLDIPKALYNFHENPSQHSSDRVIDPNKPLEIIRAGFLKRQVGSFFIDPGLNPEKRTNIMLLAACSGIQNKTLSNGKKGAEIGRPNSMTLREIIKVVESRVRRKIVID